MNLSDATIGQVLDGAGQRQAMGKVGGRGPKADTMDAAGEENGAVFCHGWV